MRAAQTALRRPGLPMLRPAVERPHREHTPQTESGAAALLRYRLDTLLSDVGALLLCLWLAGWAVRLAMELFRAVRGRAARETPGTARRLAVRFAAALALSAAFAAVGAVLAVIRIGGVGR